MISSLPPRWPFPLFPWLICWLYILCSSSGAHIFPRQDSGPKPTFNLSYDIQWVDSAKGQFGATVQLSSIIANLTSPPSFVPASEQWSVELQFRLTNNLTVTGFSSSAGTLESSSSHSNYFALTHLALQDLPVIYRINFSTDPSVFMAEATTTLATTPGAFRVYDNAKPSFTSRTEELALKRQAVVIASQPNVPTTPPNQFSNLSRKPDESFTEPKSRSLPPNAPDTLAANDDGDGDSAATEAVEEVAKRRKKVESNPYGTVLVVQPLGAYIYGGVVAIGLIVHTIGLIRRIICRKNALGAHSFMSLP
ncbi:hypothetical protein H4R33_003544 [Dimargaris cristalligena]|uniref:Uncharacterized protein n=1 Tax=Dimargaris cristalligena TaxID=215637 RepID=A0A4P9ZR36_9FUNG|nr:hypothetical protein H4R33_003544 [Dimargaris cristalligena]RKP35847.1 hypothetical protein BJ085DRAFT_28436 [Dimargaris cristalligena]|eukprot:RKP35847.1 hypothetical protein BJ085DRAFT_28436 [Dimargaris cristalligena]